MILSQETSLRHYFPDIRTREEILNDIETNHTLKKTFYSWSYERREEFLDICTGIRGMKITYDPYFKEIFNPEYDPGRLSDLLSALLGMKVRVLKVLPNDSVRIASENTLLITDIVVELEDGSIANVEMQKIGYMFTGERASCYSADLLLRQYKRLRDKKKKTFSYTDVKNVYTIVFFEKSSKEFHEYPDTYIHRIESKSDTGININMLQKYLFIPLDIFREKVQNKLISIDGKLEAWLSFLSSDDPETIITIIQRYPEFKPLYEDIYKMCRNTECIMRLFSEELEIMDNNLAQLMIDEQARQLEEGAKELEKNKQELAKNKQELAKNKQELEKNKQELAKNKQELADKDQELVEKKKQLSESEQALVECEKTLVEKDKILSEKDKEIALLRKQLTDAGL